MKLLNITSSFLICLLLIYSKLRLKTHVPIATELTVSVSLISQPSDLILLLRAPLTLSCSLLYALSSCNVRKGGKLLKNSGLSLNQNPYRPSTEDLHKNGKNFPPNFLHKSWMDYLYWDVELES